MNLHGGTLEIESTLGKGTSVTVKLPGWRRTEWNESDPTETAKDDADGDSHVVHQTAVKS